LRSPFVHRWFERTAERFPERVAVSEGVDQLTYRELDHRAEHLAQSFDSVGGARGKVVGIFLEQGIDYVIGVLGALKAGAVFLPLDVRFPNSRLAAILAKADPVVIVSNDLWAGKLSARLREMDRGSIPLFTVNGATRISNEGLAASWVEAREVSSDLDSHRKFQREDFCYLMTTSGSTGEPKAILGSHRGLSHFIDWEIGEFALNEETRVSFLSHTTFDVSLRDIFAALLSGGTLCIPDEETKQNPVALYHWMETQRITLTHIVPTLFRLLTGAIQALTPAGEVLPALEYVLIAGETLYGGDVVNWRTAVGDHPALVNIYGPSETTLAKLYCRIQHGRYGPRDVIPLGRPIPDTDVLVMSAGKLCAVGEVGEIFLRTPFMSHGYFRDPELTRSRFLQNPLEASRRDTIYKTGDLGKWSPDGNLQIVGRTDGQVKLRGQRIEVAEIEAVLHQHEEIQQVAVALKRDGSHDQRLVAYVVTRDGRPLPIEPLRRFVADYLPDYMVPTHYVHLNTLPLTHSGKVDRHGLPEPTSKRPLLEQTFLPPSNSVERKLVDLWRQVLGLDRVGIEDNFFDLGGDSVLATRLAGLTQQSTGVEIPVVKVFQYPKISLLAKFLHGADPGRSRFEGAVERARRRRHARTEVRRTRQVDGSGTVTKDNG
jgi:amino acid adenylation domain-containing protein